MLTASQLKKIMPNAGQSRRDAALPILNDVAKAYDISNERRMAAWLATLAVESGELKYQEELASGAAYEGRKDLGNTQKGDGRAFKGHGRIQITGRANHEAYTKYLKKSGHLPFVDFVAEPKKLAQEPYATDSAGWFWAVYKKLNPIADKGDFLTTQIRVNGRNKRTGLPNHWDVRNGYWVKALSVLPDDFNLSSAADTPNSDPSIPTATQNNTDTPIPSLSATDPSPTTTEVEVQKETPSLFARLGAGITALTGIGINAGSLIQTKLEALTPAQILYLALALGLVGVAVYWYMRAAKAAQIRTLHLIEKAADPTQNTVLLTK